jgi:hypothetical protein
MARRIDAGEIVAALGGLLVLVALFLDWYGDTTGWGAFELVDLLLAALALGALAIAASSFGAGWPLSPRTLVPIGLALLVIVAVQLGDRPPAVEDGDLDAGAWLALAGAALVLIGGILRTSSISVHIDVGGRDVRHRVAAVDRRGGAPNGGAVRHESSRRPPAGDPPGAGVEGGGPGAGAAAAEAARRRKASTPLADTQATQPFAPVDEEAR